MTTTAIKLKIAKTKPAPHKILPVEYRCVHFWNSSTTSVFQTAIPPLFTAFFLGAKSTGAKKPFLCHFLLQCPEALEIGSRQPLPQKQTGGAAAPPYHKSKTVGLTCRSAQISGIRSNMSRPASRFAAGFSLNPQLSTLNHLTGVLSVATISISSNHFDEIRQFLPGIEIYPFAGLVQIGQALIFFALNPHQVLVS